MVASCGPVMGRTCKPEGVEFQATQNSIPQALRLIETDEEKTKGVVGSVKDKILRPWSELKALSGTFLRSSLIGIFTGIIPGTGGDTACWFAYNEAKRRADDPQAFGTGSIYGVTAPASNIWMASSAKRIGW